MRDTQITSAGCHFELEHLHEKTKNRGGAVLAPPAVVWVLTYYRAAVCQATAMNPPGALLSQQLK